MSDTDSFINEVSEEVRNDQLFGYVRRYGWIAVTLILALVGGAAYTEWSKAQARAAAEAKGDALIAALTENDPTKRAETLGAINPEGASAAVVGLLAAAAQQEAGDLETAAATLAALATNPEVPQVYRDVASFKATLLSAEDGDQDARRQTLEALAVPGQAFNLLAQEQLALMDIEAGETDAAITTLRSIVEAAEVTRGLRERAQSLIVALGGESAEAPAAE